MEHDDEDYDERLTDEEGAVVYRCFFRLVVLHSVTSYIIFTSDCIYYS